MEFSIVTQMGNICNKIEVTELLPQASLTQDDFDRLSKLSFSHKRLIQQGWETMKLYMANIGVNVFIG